MTAIERASSSHLKLEVRQLLPRVLAVGLLLWMVFVLLCGMLLSLQIFGIVVPAPIGPIQPRNFSTLQMVWAAVLVFGLCITAALVTRRFSPAAVLPITFATGCVIVLASAVATGSVWSLVTVLAMFIAAWFLGHIVLGYLPKTEDVAVVRAPVAIGLGLSLFGLLLFLLTALTLLNAATVVGMSTIVLVLATTRREYLISEAARLVAWRPVPPSLFETVVVGITTGLVAFAVLSVFVPETASDAVRGHLPIAREIWQLGSAPALPPIWTSEFPVQAHLFYAVAYGFGGITAVKAVHALVGLTAIMGIAGLAWLNAGRIAATVGAAIFATMPLVLWELGHAYIDLFPVLFTITATLCVGLWQRDGCRGWLIIAGALAGLGFATKMTVGLVIVALALAIFLVGRAPWDFRERVLAIGLFALGTLVVIPWLIRTYTITGTLPGLAILLDFITDGQRSVVGPLSNLSDYGVGRAPIDLARIPWYLTFHGDAFDEGGRGEVGFVLLMTLPLALLGPRTRSMAFLAVVALGSFFGWAMTAQYTRYFLPTLAIAAAVCGIGVASTEQLKKVRTGSYLRAVVPVGVVLGLAITPLLFLPAWRSILPVDLVVGKESAADYVERSVRTASALAAASRELPPDTPVLYIGQHQGAQIFTEARLDYAGATEFGTTTEEVLGNLARQGINYLIWNRVDTPTVDWRSTLLSTDFLKEHTRILEGDESGYLLEILPEMGSGWSPGKNELKNPGLDPVSSFSSWTTLKKPGLVPVSSVSSWITTDPVEIHDSAVTVHDLGKISQRVPVVGGHAYVLMASSKCSASDTSAVLSLHWQDGHGTALDVAWEKVVPGTESSDQFVWHRAPKRAESVVVSLGIWGPGNCEFLDAALYESS